MKIIPVLVLFFFTFSYSFLSAQDTLPSETATQSMPSPASKSSYPDIESLTANFHGPILDLDFTLPFPGVVELKLIDTDGELLWETYYDDTLGHNHIKLDFHTLEKHHLYHYDVIYKGHHHETDFSID